MSAAERMWRRWGEDGPALGGGVQRQDPPVRWVEDVIAPLAGLLGGLLTVGLAWWIL